MAGRGKVLIYQTIICEHQSSTPNWHSNHADAEATLVRGSVELADCCLSSLMHLYLQTRLLTSLISSGHNPAVWGFPSMGPQ